MCNEFRWKSQFFGPKSSPNVWTPSVYSLEIISIWSLPVATDQTVWTILYHIMLLIMFMAVQCAWIHQKTCLKSIHLFILIHKARNENFCSIPWWFWYSLELRLEIMRYHHANLHPKERRFQPSQIQNIYHMVDIIWTIIKWYKLFDGTK